MNLDNVAAIIKELPTLVMYLVPGYLVLWIMGFMLSRDVDKDDHIVVKSIVLSYIFINVGSLIIRQSVLNSVTSEMVVMGLALVIGFATAQILLSGHFETLLRRIGVTRSIHSIFLNDIIDLKLGLYVKVYLRNERVIYAGQIRKYEERESSDNSYFVLSSYCQSDYEGVLLQDHENDDSYRILLNTKDISRMELCYHPDSLKIS
jgi:hypothetical protein